jgi:hypothetical protein
VVAVFSGHDHSYERIVRGGSPDSSSSGGGGGDEGGFPYFVNGAGGEEMWGFQPQVRGRICVLPHSGAAY